MTLLEVKGVSKNFGGLAALQDVSFSVEKGMTMGLIGPNGAGKTTLLNVIAGVCHPTAGKVVFKGQDISRLPPNQTAARGLARTFQAATSYSNLTVLQNVAAAHFLRANMGFWSNVAASPAYRQQEDAITRDSSDLIESFGLAKLKDELAKNLSQGLGKTLGLCIALATKPELLLLDEPAAGLSNAETTVQMENLRRISASGVTILLVEHKMRVIMEMCNWIEVLNFGKKIAAGTPDQVSNNKEVIEAYLGSEQGVA